MIKETKQNLKELNSLINKSNGLYHSLAKKMQLSDCAFWILYLVSDDSFSYTQSSLCSALSLPKQTINSALKNLINKNYIKFISTNNHKKNLYLTEKGKELTSKTTDKVYQYEINALAELSLEEQRNLIAFSKKFLSSFVRQIINSEG